ncbi:MAG: BatD family protein [Gammaproteobacteria bacterium]|nr:BatD family protein [Gammaproteobacteria bacterium]
MNHTPSGTRCTVLWPAALGLLLTTLTPLMAQQNYPVYPGYRMPLPFNQPGQQQPFPVPGQQQPYAVPGQSFMQPPQQRQPAVPNQYGNQPRWQQPGPNYSQRTPGSALPSAPPRVEVRLSEYRAYAQQTLLLTLELISSSNLVSVDTRLPPSGAMVFTNLEGPSTHARDSGGKREFVNQFRYAVTPLKAGKLRVPAIRIQGVMDGGDNAEFDIQSRTDLVIDVQPVNPAVQPWLPLHGLSIQSFIHGADKPAAGKPFSLVVDISAVGATGGQLPSFAEYLQKNGDFNLYREKTETEGSVSSDGRFLLGRRTESFTLVPQQGGKLQIPELKLAWWNVDTAQAETETVPMRQLIIKGDAGKDGGEIPDLFPGASSLLLWVPLIGLFSLTIGFWILSWLRRKRFVQVVEEEVVAVSGFTARQCKTFLTWLAPIRRLQKIRQIFVRSLPRSFRLWFCVKVVEGEEDPEVWSYMLKFLSNKHLQIPPQLPLKTLGERLSGVHSGSDRTQMQMLMGELEKRLYAGGQVDFSDWKRRFRAQLRPALFPFFRKRQINHHRTARLPKLNPEF